MMPTTAPIVPDAFDQGLVIALSLLVAVAGWYYMFYSKAAQRLGAVEDPSLNARRVWLRRLNGLVMLGVAALLYVGFVVLDWSHPDAVFVWWFVWIFGSLFVLLGVMIVLVLVDVRLTTRLREYRRRAAQAAAAAAAGENEDGG